MIDEMTKNVLDICVKVNIKLIKKYKVKLIKKFNIDLPETGICFTSF